MNKFCYRPIEEVLDEIQLQHWSSRPQKVFFNPELSEATRIKLDALLLECKRLKEKFNIID